MDFIKRTLVLISACIFCMFTLGACKALSSFIHDGEVIAKVGNHKLYRSDLEGYVPAGLSPEDSASLALKYIDSWASDQLFVDIAEQKLSKNEKDVSKELELYKQSLLKFRYEQRYVNERLDTLVTEEEISDYYESHKEKFKLSSPIVKVRFLKIMKDSPNLEIIKRKMCASKIKDLEEADSLAYSSALKYTDYGNAWLDAATLASEFGVDYATMLSAMSGSIIQMEDGLGNVNIAYIVEMMNPGKIAPLDFCREKIKDIILSCRKHNLVTNLEKDLITTAREQGKFVIVR